MDRFLGVDLAWTGATPATAKNESGVVALDRSGAVLDAGWRVGVHDVEAWMAEWSTSATLAFIDAPLVVNNATGQRQCERQVGQRYGKWWVSANSTNLNSTRLAGVTLREHLEKLGWEYDDGLSGPPEGGRVVSECYPYTTIVGVPELGYDDKRPMYKRKPKSMTIGEFRPARADACDDLIARTQKLADPPLKLESHPATSALVTEPSPRAGDRDYKHREDLLDAALCAWTALLWATDGLDRCQILGGPEGDVPTAQIGTIICPRRPTTVASTLP